MSPIFNYSHWDEVPMLLSPFAKPAHPSIMKACPIILRERAAFA
jgi:hypothetical protein